MGSFPLRLLLCQLALLGVSSVARAGVTAAVPGDRPAATPAASPTNPAGGGAAAAPDLWAPYSTEFGEASRWLVALAVTQGDPSPADDDQPTDSRLVAGSGTAPFDAERCELRLLDLYRSLNTFLQAMGMGSPANTVSSGSSSPTVPSTAYVLNPEVDRPEGGERLATKRPPLPALILASRLFRPPRAADAMFVSCV